MRPSTTPRSARFRVAGLVSMQLAWVGILAAGVKVMVAGSTGVGLVLLLAGAVTAALSLRRLGAALHGPAEVDAVGELRGPAFDYLVWTAIGLPLLVIALLLVV